MSNPFVVVFLLLRANSFQGCPSGCIFVDEAIFKDWIQNVVNENLLAAFVLEKVSQHIIFLDYT